MSDVGANAIRLELRERIWVGVYEGPHRARIVQLFGMGYLPTPFTRTVPGSEVQQILQGLQPGVRVYLAESMEAEKDACDELR